MNSKTQHNEQYEPEQVGLLYYFHSLKHLIRSYLLLLTARICIHSQKEDLGETRVNPKAAVAMEAGDPVDHVDQVDAGAALEFQS